MTEDRSEWDDIAEAAIRQRNSRCPVEGCAHLIMSRDGAIPVHFSSVTSTKPCFGSWKYICQKCGGLVGPGRGGKLAHLATGVRECSSPASPPASPPAAAR